MDCRRWSFELCEIAALNFAAGLDGLRDASDVPAAPSVPLGKSCQFAIRTLLKTRRHFQPRVSKTGRVCTYCGSSLGTVTAGPTAQHYAGSLPQISRHPLHRNRRGEPKYCAPTDRPTDRHGVKGHLLFLGVRSFGCFVLCRRCRRAAEIEECLVLKEH